MCSLPPLLLPCYKIGLSNFAQFVVDFYLEINKGLYDYDLGPAA